jgi:hypothetical protein
MIGYAAALGASWPLSMEANEDSTSTVGEWWLPAALFAVLVGLAVAASGEDNPAISAPMFAMVFIAALALAARLAINFGVAKQIDTKRARLITWIVEHKRAA